MGILVKDIDIAAFGMGSWQCPSFGDLAYGDAVLRGGEASFFGGNALMGGDVVMSQGLRGFNGTSLPVVTDEEYARPTQAPVRHRAVPAPHPWRPPV